MKNTSISILISNYNKEKYLRKCLNSCIDQDYENYEILLGDNGSDDNSLKIIKNFQNIKLFNIEKKFQTNELNQLDIIKNLLNNSKGEIILLLDSDDYFEKNKLKTIATSFNENSNKEFICDIARIVNKNNQNSIFKYKKNINFKKRWPSIFPTSTISIRRKSLLNFFNEKFVQEYAELAIDFRLVTYFYNFKENFSISEQLLTNYVNFNDGTESKYKKYTSRWWKRRYQSYEFLKEILKKKNIEHDKTADYILTKFLNKIF